MRKNSLIRYIIIVGIAIVISNCGPGQFLGPKITPIPSKSPTSKLTNTATFTPTQTPTPSPLSKLLLAQIGIDGKLIIADNTDKMLYSYQTDKNYDENSRIIWSPNGKYILVNIYKREPAKQLMNGKLVDSIAAVTREILLIDLEKHNMNAWNSLPDCNECGIELNWSPNSSLVSIDMYQRLLGTHYFGLIASDGTDFRMIFRNWQVNNTPSWSPDGKTLAVAGAPIEMGGDFHLYLINVESGKYTDVTPDDATSVGFGNGWIKDGRLYYYAIAHGNKETYRILDLQTLKSSVLFNFPYGSNIRDFNLSPSGTRVTWCENIIKNNPWSQQSDFYVGEIKDNAIITNSLVKVWSIVSEDKMSYYYSLWSPLEKYLVIRFESDNGGGKIINIMNQAMIDIPSRAIFFKWLDEVYYILWNENQKWDIYNVNEENLVATYDSQWSVYYPSK